MQAQAPDQAMHRHQRRVAATRGGCMDQHRALPIHTRAQRTQHAVHVFQRLAVDGVQQETCATTVAVRGPVLRTQHRSTVKAMVEDGRTLDAVQWVRY